MSHALPRQRGFTLIEVMIVVAIIAILASIAIPSYRDYIIRGQLTEATTALSGYRAKMERHFQDNRDYRTVGTFVTPCALGNDASRTIGKFVVSCAGTPTSTTYIVQAVGTGSMSGFTLSVNEKDEQKSDAGPAGYGVCARHWILKRGQAC
ncbi:fimbrial assembly protein [Rhizobacter sp. Root1221]|nr:fimbrial assembly protein [Rhizobacter sp. Root1221]